MQGDIIDELLAKFPGRLRTNASLKKYNWFRIDSTAQLLFAAHNQSELRDFIILLSQYNIASPIIIGVGSNILLSTESIERPVIILGDNFKNIRYDNKNHTIICGSAVMCPYLANFAAAQQLAGFSFLAGIPGTIGGSIAGNAGAYGGEISDIIYKAEILLPNGEIIWQTPQELFMSYRKCQLPDDSIILSAKFYADKFGDTEQLLTEIANINNQRKLSQPHGARTGGSSFKNPSESQIANLSVETKRKLLNKYQLSNISNLKAWHLIDFAGCRGYRVNNAEISTQHCNFIVSLGEVSGQDILKLGELVRSKVYASSNIRLEWEIRII